VSLLIPMHFVCDMTHTNVGHFRIDDCNALDVRHASFRCFELGHVSVGSLFMLSGEEQNTNQEIVVFIHLFVHIFYYSRWSTPD